MGPVNSAQVHCSQENWLKVAAKKKKKKRKMQTWEVGSKQILSVGLDPRLSFAFAFFSSLSFSFFFFSAAHVSEETKFTVHVLFNTIHTMFRYCSRTVHGTYSHFIHKKNIKNRSHGTIHTFKNYFAIVFSIFSFQFQQK